MKKLLTIAAVALTLTASAQRTGQGIRKPSDPIHYNAKAPASKPVADTIPAGPKVYIIQGDLTAYEALMEVLEQSDASHKKVEALKKWIVEQIQKQLPAASGK